MLSSAKRSPPSTRSSASSPRRNPLDRLMSSTLTACNPHSVLPLPAQRPDRGSSPGGDRSGARPAADRRVAAFGEWVLGQQFARSMYVRHVVVAPRRQRVDLDDVAQQVVAARSACWPGSVRRPGARPSPSRTCRQRPLQRLDLAHVAARLDVVLPPVVGRRRAVPSPAGSGPKLPGAAGRTTRLGEQVLRVEQDDGGAGRRSADEVRQHGVGEAARHDEAVAELRARPTEHLEGMRGPLTLSPVNQNPSNFINFVRNCS